MYTVKHVFSDRMRLLLPVINYIPVHLLQHHLLAAVQFYISVHSDTVTHLSTYWNIQLDEIIHEKINMWLTHIILVRQNKAYPPASKINIRRIRWDFTNFKTQTDTLSSSVTPPVHIILILKRHSFCGVFND